MRIDLARFQEQGSTTFLLAEHGQLVRRHSRLDDADTAGGAIELIVPRNTTELSATFFFALFGASIRASGLEGFRKRLRVKAPRRVRIAERWKEAEMTLSFLTRPAQERAMTAARFVIGQPVPSARRVAQLASVNLHVAGDALEAARAELHALEELDPLEATGAQEAFGAEQTPRPLRVLSPRSRKQGR